MTSTTPTYQSVSQAYQCHEMNDKLLNLAAGTLHMGLKLKVDAFVSDTKTCYLASIESCPKDQEHLVPVLQDMRACCMTTRLGAIAEYARDTARAQTQIVAKEVKALIKMAGKLAKAKKAPAETLTQLTPLSLPLIFGQLRASTHFQSDSGDKSSLEIKVPNKEVRKVATELQSDDYSQIHTEGSTSESFRLSMVLPVEVFPHFGAKGSAPVAIAINNRGMATHALANTRPVRVLPRLPTEKELQRLGETEVDGKRFKRSKPDQNTPELAKERTLPSPQIPLTKESTGGKIAVDAVAQIPADWAIKLDQY